MDMLDIARSANLVIKEHGEGAAEFARQRMEALVRADDAKGAGVWLAILHDIDQLQSNTAKRH